MAQSMPQTAYEWLLLAMNSVLAVSPAQVVSGLGERWVARSEPGRSSGRHPMALHKHPFSEICIALHGKAAMDVGAGRYPFEPPGLAFLDAGVEHCEAYARRGGAYALLWVAPSQAGLMSAVSTYDRSGSWHPMHRLTLRSRHGRALSEAMADREARSDPHWLETARGALLGALGALAMRESARPVPVPHSGHQEGQRHRATLSHLQAFLDDHLSEQISVAQLASMTRLSPNYLNRLFVRWCGRSLHSYLQRRRMEVALDLCQRGELLIKEIAGRVGYPDPLYFSRAFHKYHGFWPTECAGTAGHPRPPKEDATGPQTPQVASAPREVNSGAAWVDREPQAPLSVPATEDDEEEDPI